MANKTRLPIEVQKRSRIGVRLTDKEKNSLLQYANSHGMTITEVVAAAVKKLIEDAETLSLN